MSVKTARMTREELIEALYENRQDDLQVEMEDALSDFREYLESAENAKLVAMWGDAIVVNDDQDE
jgi:hypothetical protein